MSRGAVGQVTIREVAEASGVSIQTVSRVLNERPDVAVSTRARVEAVIEELGYEPNVQAQGLVTQRKTSIGFVTSGLDYVGVGNTLEGVAVSCEKRGFGLLLKTVPPTDHEALTEAIRFFIRRGVLGVIVLLPRLHLGDYVASKHFLTKMPHIIFLRSQGHDDFTTVTVDSEKGARLATQHLLDGGRTKVGHIAGGHRVNWFESQARFAGWKQALVGAGHTPESAHVVEGDWSSQSGEDAFEKLLANYPDLDSVFVANDQMALGVLAVCHKRGIRVPEDVAVVGFDNLDEAAQYSPPLTTVAQPLADLGRVAVEQLLREVDDESLTPALRVLDVELVVRESSTPQ